MKTVTTIAIAGGVLLPVLTPQSDVLTDATLKSTIEGLAYETKEIGTDPKKPKVFEFTAKTEKFNIPIASEMSSSGNYVWFTVVLGDAPKDGDKAIALLKSNGEIQPDFFYTTSGGKLKLGIAVDNRGINAVVAKRIIDKLVADVDKTASLWQ